MRKPRIRNWMRKMCEAKDPALKEMIGEKLHSEVEADCKARLALSKPKKKASDDSAS